MKKALIASLIVISLLLLTSGAMANHGSARANSNNGYGEADLGEVTSAPECPDEEESAAAEENCAPEETCAPIVIDVPELTCPDIDVELPETPCFPDVIIGEFPEICCPEINFKFPEVSCPSESPAPCPTPAPEPAPCPEIDSGCTGDLRSHDEWMGNHEWTGNLMR